MGVSAAEESRMAPGGPGIRPGGRPQMKPWGTNDRNVLELRQCRPVRRRRGSHPACLEDVGCRSDSGQPSMPRCDGLACSIDGVCACACTPGGCRLPSCETSVVALRPCGACTPGGCRIRGGLNDRRCSLDLCALKRDISRARWAASWPRGRRRLGRGEPALPARSRPARAGSGTAAWPRFVAWLVVPSGGNEATARGDPFRSTGVVVVAT